MPIPTHTAEDLSRASLDQKETVFGSVVIDSGRSIWWTTPNNIQTTNGITRVRYCPHCVASRAEVQLTELTWAHVRAARQRSSTFDTTLH